MPRLRSIIRVLIAGAAGGLVGYFIGVFLDGWQHELTVAGFALGALSEMWHITKQRRWFIVGLLAVLYVVSYIQGGIIALLAALAATALTFILSAVIVRHLYPGGEWEALMHHLRLALGMTRGFMIVEDAKIIVPKDSKGPLFGPYELIVKPYNAVTLERGHQQTRIVGPAHVTTDPFEYVKEIVSIGRQQERLEIPNVLSKDSGPVTVTLYVTYRMDLPDSVILGREKFDNNHKAILQDILLNTPDWKGQTRAAIQAAVRHECNRKVLDQLLDPSEYEGMQTSILVRSRAAAANWKVVVGTVMFENVQPPPEIEAALTSKGTEDTKGEIYKQRAIVAHDALMTLADAHRHAKASGMTEDMINRMLMLELLRIGDQDSRVERDREDDRQTTRRAAVRLTIDRDIKDLDEVSINELINTIALRTRAEADDIHLLYIIPGSARVVLDMSDEDALRLIDLYLKGDPIMGQFNIIKVNVERLPLDNPVARPLLDRPRDLDLDGGLEALRDILQNQSVEILNEFSTLEARLRVAETDIRIFTGDGSNQAERNRVIGALNDLTSRVRPGLTFTDLCMKRAVH